MSRPLDDAGWAARADELEAFMARAGRRPSESSVSSTERSIAWWLACQRTHLRGTGSAAATLTPWRRAYLDARVPGWADESGGWFDAAGELVAWVRERHALPRRRSVVEREARLGEWLHAQRRAARWSRLAPERAAWLEERVPGWRIVKEAAKLELIA